jgi:phage terminase large subunit-like protein
MQIRQIERTIASGSKTQRFLEIQPFIASKRISFSRNAKHRESCISHMSKITANETHRHDDIADTLSDAIRIALIEKTIYSNDNKEVERKLILENMNQSLQRKIRARTALYGGHSQKTY